MFASYGKRERNEQVLTYWTILCDSTVFYEDENEDLEGRKRREQKGKRNSK